MSVSAGMLNNRVRFERRDTADDGYGNTVTTWQTLFTNWAGFRPVSSREELAAGRLQSSMTGVLSVRKSSQTEGLTAADRCVFTAGAYAGKVANIRSIVPSMDNSMFEITIEEGVAT